MAPAFIVVTRKINIDQGDKVTDIINAFGSFGGNQPEYEIDPKSINVTVIDSNSAIVSAIAFKKS